MFDRRQRQQLVHHLRHPLALRGDAGDEAPAISLRQRLLQ